MIRAFFLLALFVTTNQCLSQSISECDAILTQSVLHVANETEFVSHLKEWLQQDEQTRYTEYQEGKLRGAGAAVIEAIPVEVKLSKEQFHALYTQAQKYVNSGTELLSSKKAFYSYYSRYLRDKQIDAWIDCVEKILEIERAKTQNRPLLEKIGTPTLNKTSGKYRVKVTLTWSRKSRNEEVPELARPLTLVGVTEVLSKGAPSLQQQLDDWAFFNPVAEELIAGTTFELDEVDCSVMGNFIGAKTLEVELKAPSDMGGRGDESDKADKGDKPAPKAKRLRVDATVEFESLTKSHSDDRTNVMVKWNPRDRGDGLFAYEPVDLVSKVAGGSTSIGNVTLDAVNGEAEGVIGGFVAIGTPGAWLDNATPGSQFSKRIKFSASRTGQSEPFSVRAEWTEHNATARYTISFTITPLYE